MQHRFTGLQPRIIYVEPKLLVGHSVRMSLATNLTPALWQGFMPFHKKIENRASNDLISMQDFPAGFDFTFSNLNTEFDKWAAVEVTDGDNIPEGMKSFQLPGGLYAAFHYCGSSADTDIFRYIFGEWLPASNYDIDDRPHFEILGEKYKNNSPDSEEEILIPVKTKITHTGISD